MTNAQYLAVLEAGGVDLAARRRRPGFLAHLEAPAPGWEDAPVRCVSWADAAEFCRLLGRLVAAPVRLPAEVEWELAAAGTGPAPRRFPWGDAPPALTPSGLSVAQDRTPAGVAGLGLGLHEWCVDPWRPRRWAEATGPLAHRPSAVVVPEPKGADAMTCRGGGPDARSALQVECAWRQGRLAATRGRGVGFRVVIPWAP
ncbi:MAG: formylglycine-generating enzyme family protein [Planctomycetes bacterium]|nr:formylglycine-generating enzyme family protein [Planctomycetota bacterium]